MRNKRTDTLHKTINESNELIVHLRLRTYDQVTIGTSSPKHYRLTHKALVGPRVDTDLHRNMVSVQSVIAHLLDDLSK